MAFNMGFYGFGEAAGNFAIELHKKWPEIKLVAYDKFVTERVADYAAKANVCMVLSPQELAGRAEVIGALVTGSVCLKAAEDIVGFMKETQLYIDFNSVSPKEKMEIGKIFEKAKIPMVDAAIMESVPESKLDASILISGEQAPRASDGLNALGFKTSVVGGKVGDAAAIKMVRSIFAKGMEGLFVEMLLAGKKYGVQEYVIDSIAKSIEDKKIIDIMNTLVVSQANHSARKKTEMDYVVSVLTDAGIEPIMSSATRDMFEWITGLNLKDKIDPATADYQTVIDAII